MALHQRLHFSDLNGVTPPAGHYCHVAVVPIGLWQIALAGQLSMRPDGATAQRFLIQFEAAFENIITILRGRAPGPEHTVKQKTWIADGAAVDCATVTKTLERPLGDARPFDACHLSRRLTADFFWNSKR